MFAVIVWAVDGLHSVVRLRTIMKPRKEEDNYVVGEKVVAKWQGSELEATIVSINGMYK